MSASIIIPAVNGMLLCALCSMLYIGGRNLFREIAALRISTDAAAEAARRAAAKVAADLAEERATRDEV